MKIREKPLRSVVKIISIKSSAPAPAPGGKFQIDKQRNLSNLSNSSTSSEKMKTRYPKKELNVI